MVDILLNAGAAIDAHDHSDSTAMHKAASLGHRYELRTKSFFLFAQVSIRDLDSSVSISFRTRTGPLLALTKACDL
jgi:hypothetical protein